MNIEFNYIFTDIDSIKDYLLTSYLSVKNVVTTDTQTLVVVDSLDDETAIQTYVNSKIQLESIKSIISGAISFGQQLMEEFAAENVLMGITQAGKTKVVADYLANTVRYMQTGSLYEVINEIDSLIAAGIPSELSPFVTESRLLAFKSLVQGFLS